MNKENIIEKLKTLGITSTNCYPKSSFLNGDVVSIGCFASELEEDFYFYNTYNKNIYLLKLTPKSEFPVEEFRGRKKYIVPLSVCSLVWEDKEFEEKPDIPYKDMTLRQYACIQLQVADSGLPWLDVIIRKGMNLRDISDDTGPM